MHIIRYTCQHEKRTLLMLLLSVVMLFAHSILAPGLLSLAVLMSLLCLILAVMWAGIFSVVRHADHLAEILGEPYGTLILTLSVISIEVMMIIMLMIFGKPEPTLARDTVYSVFMIAVNGFVGLSLFWGGIKHKMQNYNLHGANAYLSALIPLVIISLVLPNFTSRGSLASFSTADSFVIIAICVLLYVVFLTMQTMTHPGFFRHDLSAPKIETAEEKEMSHNISYHVCLLLAGIVLMLVLAKQMTGYLEVVIYTLAWPKALVGLIIALLILMPEGYSAVCAARQNEIQRSVNLCMGSALATVCLTVPSVLVICLLMHQKIILGLDPVNTVLLVLTLFVSTTTFTSRQTNFLNGAVHLSLFAVYLLVFF